MGKRGIRHDQIIIPIIPIRTRRCHRTARVHFFCFALHAIVSHGDDVDGPTSGAWNLAVWQLSERFVACLKLIIRTSHRAVAGRHDDPWRVRGRLQKPVSEVG